ncbi:MAG: ZIP family metal transporter [Candidatus Nanohaloarchaea archaeon]
MSLYTDISIALGLTSILSAIGAFFLFLSKDKVDNLVEYLISLSAGTIFGGVFIHLIFRLANPIGYTRETGLLIMAGIAFSLILERTVHWHCHNQETHKEPFSYVLLAGDGVHNILDGILITTSFLASTSAGIASTVAIAAHKIPKEVGDFGVLLEGGFSRERAIGANILISLFMFIGAGIVLALSTLTENIVALLLPLVVGNFIYIAGSDLLPRFKKSDTHIAPHLLMFGIGTAIMYAIPFIKQAII